MPYTGDNSDEESRAHNGDTTQNYGATGGDKDTDQLSQIVHELQRINRRIDRIELRQPVFSLKAPSEKSPPGSLRANESANLNDCLDPSGPVSPASKDNTADDSEFKEIQENFNAIKASLERVILPAKYKLHDSRNGIKREDQPALNIISKCGRYIETALKLVSDFEEGIPNDIAQLSIVLVANLKYLQDEYAALLVKGRFDNTTSQLFRSLQKNTSGFDHGGIREGATSGPTSNEPCASPTIYHLIVKSYQLLVKWPLSCAILHCSRSAGKRKWHLRMRAVNLIFLSCKIIINKNIVTREGFIEGRFYL